MLAMGLPVLGILRRQGWMTDDQQILGVFLLGGFGEVKAASHDQFTIDDDHLMVRNRVVGVDQSRHPLIRQEIGRRILLRALTLVQDDLHLDTAFVGVQ